MRRRLGAQPRIIRKNPLTPTGARHPGRRAQQLRRRSASSRSGHAIIAAMHRLSPFLGLCIALAIMATSGAGAAENAAPRHHRESGFQNNHVDFEPKGLGALLQWRIDALRDGLPKPPRTPTPVMAADLAYLRSNAAARLAMEPAITWIGHATLLVQAGGANILTDPIFSRARIAARLHRSETPRRPGIALADLPRIDAVVISHNHYDHLDDASVQALAVQPGGAPLFIVPLGLKAWFAERGIERVVELDWWQSHARRRGRGRADAGAALVGPQPDRPHGDAVGRLCAVRAGLPLCSSPATPATRRTSPTSARASRRARAQPTAAASTSRCCRSAPTSRAGSCAPQHADPDGGGADPPGPRREAVDRHALGHVRADRRVARPAAGRPGRGASARGLADAAFSVLAIGETRRFPRRAR